MDLKAIHCEQRIEKDKPHQTLIEEFLSLLKAQGTAVETDLDFR